MRALIAFLIGASVSGLPRAAAAGDAEAGAEDPVVHVRFPAGSYLPYIDRQTPGGWQPVCKAPCDRRLSSSGVYRVRGRTGNAPESFVLPSTSRVRVDAYVGSRAADILGPVLVVSGLATFTAGTTALLWPTDGGAGPEGGRLALGVAGILVGVIVGGVGALVWHFGSSDVTVTPERSATGLTSAARPAFTSGLRWTGDGFVF